MAKIFQLALAPHPLPLPCPRASGIAALVEALPSPAPPPAAACGISGTPCVLWLPAECRCARWCSGRSPRPPCQGKEEAWDWLEPHKGRRLRAGLGQSNTPSQNSWPFHHVLNSCPLSLCSQSSKSSNLTVYVIKVGPQPKCWLYSWLAGGPQRQGQFNTCFVKNMWSER